MVKGVMFNINFLEMLFIVTGLVFAFWPLAVIAPIERRKDVVLYMTFAWGIMAVMWLISLFSPGAIGFSLIPEPLNSALFFITGAALLAIQAGGRYWQRRQIQGMADTARRVEDLLRLSPTEFEKMVVELYTAMGHKAKRTGRIGDHGVDVVIQAKNGEKWIVQCKRWRGTVGEPVVRDFYGAMHHEKADKGAIITTGTFTPQARAWAKGKPITLLEGDKFLAYLERARALAQPGSAAETQEVIEKP